MAYAKANSIQNIGPQGAANHLWFYVDGDALDVIDGVSYFDLESDKLQVNDVIIAVGNSVIGLFRVNSNTGTPAVVDLDNAIPLPVAVIDSD